MPHSGLILTEVCSTPDSYWEDPSFCSFPLRLLDAKAGLPILIRASIILLLMLESCSKIQSSSVCLGENV